MTRRINRRRQTTTSGGRWRRVGRVLTQGLMVGAIVALGVGAGALGVRVRQALRSGELFDIQHIDLVGAEHASADELLELAGLVEGMGLYSFDADELEASLLEHPWVATARIVRRPPHVLRVFIVEQQPVAYLSLDHVYACDARGQLIARAEVLALTGLPLITGLSRDEVNPQAGGGASLTLALQALAEYQRAGLKDLELSEIHINRALGVDLYTLGSPEHIHLGHGALTRKLSQVRRLRAALQHRGLRARSMALSDGSDARRIVVSTYPTDKNTSNSGIKG